MSVGFDWLLVGAMGWVTGTLVDRSQVEDFGILGFLPHQSLSVDWT